jgi:hypothetical protein
LRYTGAMGETITNATTVWNERTKLLASAIDRASTAVGASAIFPLINLWHGAIAGQDLIYFGFSAYVCLTVSIFLHMIARWTLRWLR